MSITRDQNGHPLYQRPRRLSDGTWAALTWASGAYTPSNIAVRTYRTQAAARYGAVNPADDPEGYIGYATAAQEAEYWDLVGDYYGG